MLVLSRRKNETICLGESIEITVIRISGDRVRIGVRAPADLPVLRQELNPKNGTAKKNPNHRTIDVKRAA